MSRAATVLEQYPTGIGVDEGLLAAAIDAALDGFRTCIDRAVARLSKHAVLPRHTGHDRLGGSAGSPQAAAPQG